VCADRLYLVSVIRMASLLRFVSDGLTASAVGSKQRSLPQTRGAPKGAAGLQPSPNPPKPKFKTTDFVDMTISNVLRDSPFSGNQPLKSADHCYIRILQIKLIKLKRQEDCTHIPCIPCCSILILSRYFF
jgi:hypothetical protein